MGVTNKQYGITLTNKIIHSSNKAPTAQGSEFGPYSDYSIGVRRVYHFKYDFSIDGGAISTIQLATPGLYIPATAILMDFTMNSVVAPVGSGASISFGVSAGGSTTTLKGTTAITSFTLDAIVKGAMAITAPVKMTALGYPTMTVSGAVLTAGVIECWLDFLVAVAA